MYTTIGSQAHEVDALAVLFRVRESGNDLLVLQDAVVCACPVDLYQVLINDTAGANVQVTYLRVPHLAIRQAYILAARL